MKCNNTLCKRHLTNGECVKLVGEECKYEQAKEIIKELLSCARNYPEENLKKIQEAEQFINDNKIICEKNTGKFFGTVS